MEFSPDFKSISPKQIDDIGLLTQTETISVKGGNYK